MRTHENALRRWRQERELTQVELARRAGVSETTVIRAEGDSPVNSTTRKKLIDALDAVAPFEPLEKHSAKWALDGSIIGGAFRKETPRIPTDLSDRLIELCEWVRRPHFAHLENPVSDLDPDRVDVEDVDRLKSEQTILAEDMAEEYQQLDERIYSQMIEAFDAIGQRAGIEGRYVHRAFFEADARDEYGEPAWGNTSLDDFVPHRVIVKILDPEDDDLLEALMSVMAEGSRPTNPAVVRAWARELFDTAWQMWRTERTEFPL